MISRIFSLLVFTAVASFGAQSSGFFFDAHVSQGKRNGDTLYNFDGTKIGIKVGDSICYIENGKETTEENNLGSLHYDQFQYAVRYAFLVGYEKSFNKVVSVRGAVGYQNASMEAHAATIPGYFDGDDTEIPYVSAKIDRHWISVPIDFKVTLPIRRGGLYLAAGPKASILLSTTYKDSITNTTEDLGDLTPRFNFALGFRFGAEIAIANAGYLFFESGYHKGLLNTSPISSATTKEGEITLIGLGFRINVPSKKNMQK